MDDNGGRRSKAVPVVVACGAITVSAALVVALPTFVGASWTAIGATLGAVPSIDLVLLAVLWFAGLVVHAPVLMAAMPGLTARRALALNLSGSAVSDLLPLGGPAGMGLGYAMARSWGFRADTFAAFTVSTNLWNYGIKFCVSLAILGGASLCGVGLPAGVGMAVLSATAFIVIGVAVGAVALRSTQAALATGRRLDALISKARPRRATSCGPWLLGTRDELLSATKAGWKQMALGVFLYVCLQGALLFACLAVVGATGPLSAVLVAFAIERLISLAPLTPGSAGISELGTVAALTSLGVAAVPAAAGVLLYRILTFAMEIPIGGAIALTWLHSSRTTAVAAVAAVAEGWTAEPKVLVGA